MCKPKGVKYLIKSALFSGILIFIISWSGCDLLTDLGSVANKSSSAGSSASAATNMDLAVTAASPSSISYGGGNINFTVTVKNEGMGFSYPDKIAMLDLYVSSTNGLTIFEIMGCQHITNIPILMMASGQSISTNFNIDISAYGQPGDNYFYFSVFYFTNNGSGFSSVFETDGDNIMQLNTTPAVKSGSSSSGSSASSASSTGVSSSANSSVASSIASSINSSAASSIASSTASSSSASAGGGGSGSFQDDFNRPDSPTIGNYWMQWPPMGYPGMQSAVCITNGQLMCQGYYTNGQNNGVVIERDANLVSNIKAEFTFTMDQGSKLAGLLFTDTNTHNGYMFYVSCSNFVIQKDFLTIGSFLYFFFNPTNSFTALFSKTGSSLSISLSNNITFENTNFIVTDSTYSIFNFIDIGGGWYDFYTTNHLRTYIDDFKFNFTF